jgi:hypothetical protein
MGDHGKLRKLSVQFRGFHWQGDAIRLHGKVTENLEVDTPDEILEPGVKRPLIMVPY